MDQVIAPLDRTSIHSLYEQVIARMRGFLSSMEAGALVPTEAELVKMFAVGRSTVRKAMQVLVNEGVLERRRGKGTFVARPLPKIIHPIDRVMPFIETFRQTSSRIVTKLIHYGWITDISLPAELRHWRQPVLQYDRLYLSQDVPHAVIRVCLPYDIGREVSAATVEGNPLYKILTDIIGLELPFSRFLVSCDQPPAVISDMLELPKSVCLLTLIRLTLDKEKNPVEMTTHYLRPDVYKLSVTLQ